jgi:hypothetical protein
VKGFKVNKLVSVLGKRRVAVLAQKLCDLHGGRRRSWRRRAEHSNGMVIGMKDGYVMTAKATTAQMNNWRARFNGQIEEMKARKRAVEKARKQAVEKARKRAVERIFKRLVRLSQTRSTK